MGRFIATAFLVGSLFLFCHCTADSPAGHAPDLELAGGGGQINNEEIGETTGGGETGGGEEGGNGGEEGGGGDGGGDDGGGVPEEPSPTLKDVGHFMYQIQHINYKGAVDKLAATHYDMLVIEPTFTIKGDENFDVKGAVEKLKGSPAGSFKNKLVFAYVDIGEAEEYRTYWNGWKRPVKDGTKCGKPGDPDFIVSYDPDGWAENYPVAFWDARWVAIMKEIFKKLAEAGFDGAYLDWVEAYQDDCVVAAGLKAGITDPAQKMVEFIRTLKNYARTINPNFMVIAQNAIELGEDKQDYLKLIEGLGVENIYFDGSADAEWNDPVLAVGDIAVDPSDTEYFIDILTRTYLKAGIPVFSIDYAVIPSNVNHAYTEARKHGFIPLVTQISLSNITTTPPPGY